MTDERLELPLPWHAQLRAWILHPSSWLQVARFLVVGAVGYTVNLAVFAAGVHVAAIEYRMSAVIAFFCALTTTFLLNRRFTFAAHGEAIVHQAWRYALVNGAGFAANLGVLQLLVERGGMAKVPAEAIAAILAAPVNFAGMRLWAFATRS